MKICHNVGYQYSYRQRIGLAAVLVFYIRLARYYSSIELLKMNLRRKAE